MKMKIKGLNIMKNVIEVIEKDNPSTTKYFGGYHIDEKGYIHDRDDIQVKNIEDAIILTKEHMELLLKCFNELPQGRVNREFSIVEVRE